MSEQDFDAALAAQQEDGKEQPKMITGTSDAELLRILADDMPDMAPEVRSQLRYIATSLDEGHEIGTLRCARCGEKATIHIHQARLRKDGKEQP
jgi:hypothetical protein